MKNLKRRNYFLNENIDGIDWNKVDMFINIVSKDIQLDDTHDDFLGFIALDPSDNNLIGLNDFIKADKLNPNILKNYLYSCDLEIESLDEEELIIREVNDKYENINIKQYLESKKCIETADGWNCDFVLRCFNKRIPLISNGKIKVKLNKVKGIDITECDLKSLINAPKYITGEQIYIEQGNYINSLEIDWYMDMIKKGKGYKNYYQDLLIYIVKNGPNQISEFNWPEGFITDEVIKSAKGISKFNLF